MLDRVLIRFFFALALMLGALPLFAVDELQLRDPRPAGWVVDKTGKLSAHELIEINRLCGDVKRNTTGEIAVLIIDTTDRVDQRALGTRVFNRWGLGNAQRHDGILIFFAMLDRRVEIILGDGVDSTVFVNASQSVVDNDIKPALRQGDLGRAVKAGITGCAKRILHMGESSAPVTVQPAQNTAVSTPLQPATSDVAIAQPKRLVEQPEQPSTLRSSPTPYPRTPASPAMPSSRDYSGTASSVLVRTALIGIVGGGLGLLVWLVIQARKPRNCRHCHTDMVQLSERQDDQHLAPGERAEERVGSVNYDVWACPSCNAIEKVRRRAWFTSYSRCPSCRALTKHSYSRTIHSATYSHGGLVQIDERCVACPFHETYHRSTPRLVQSTDNDTFFSRSNSNSSFGGSSHSSSSSFGGSSSSSSSSSSGGGHSSGRGGGGSW
jgi:uncharacterized protein